VFVADLTCELRAWPQDTWAKVGVDPEQVAQAVIGCWQDGEATGLQVDDLSFEEARSLAGPAMTSVRGQLRGRLTARLARAHRRWLHPPAVADPATSSCNQHSADDTRRGRSGSSGRSIRRSLPRYSFFYSSSRMSGGAKELEVNFPPFDWAEFWNIALWDR
jgi:hypothetical protein